MRSIRYLDNVVTLALDPEACLGCGLCSRVCPHGVLAMKDGRATLVDRDGCMECGACAMNCPSGAVTVRPGVGCATLIIQTWLGVKNGRCC